MEAGMILPDVTDVDAAPFWAATGQKKLVAQRCDGCGRMRLPPHPFCHECRSRKASWVELSGRGRLWSFAMHHGPTMPAYLPFTPFPVIVVELEEDARMRMTGNIVAKEGAAINSVDPATIRIGMPLKVTFHQVADDVTLPYWVAA